MRKRVPERKTSKIFPRELSSHQVKISRVRPTECYLLVYCVLINNYTESRTSPSGQQQQGQGSQQSSASMVNFTPLNRSSDAYGNLNPAMNAQGRGSVQVMNVLDGGGQGTNLAEFEMSDTGFLEGLPGSMFDWRR